VQKSNGVQLPTPDKRTVVIGSTGSGKTQFAVWLLFKRHNARRVTIIFDTKGDALIEALNPTEISIAGGVPKKPGLYVVRPIPELHDELVKQFLWQIWKRGDVLIFIDEGYMIGNRNAALNACLTQGRSKHIEMIILSQRPVWMSKFVFSEANFFAVMNLTLKDDRDFVRGYVGGTAVNLLPKYHALWYDVDRQQDAILSPVPSREELIEGFAALTKKGVKVI
jgi:Type IV secretion-system coupling protein DNA-binding domain